ncbi:MAG TPA: hypothetical protein VFZ09_44900 [Archangium sp.]|uniref:hypothetical protein n=1 Tax=Archangium sp. TaxID=1872627 RepID=UPI002E37F398|nr:hypothetical protein [Archangium sp.]HEX5753421.1 hypothetical protein [Archangium sp.]
MCSSDEGLLHLPEFTTFEALWEALERHPLALKGARDMVAVFDDDALDWIGELAGETQVENQQLIRPVVASLARLCQFRVPWWCCPVAGPDGRNAPS